MSDKRAGQQDKSDPALVNADREEALTAKESAKALAEVQAEAEVVTTPEGVPARALFPRARLINESQAFLGQPPHVVAGALDDIEDEELTIERASNAVGRWLGRESE